LISIPLTFQYLGSERFGLWMTISSFIVMLGVVDLGNGLINLLADALARNDREAASTYVASTAFVTGTIAIILLIVFALVYPWVSWGWLFNVSSELGKSEAGSTVAIVVWCAAVNLPLGVVLRVRMGQQKWFINNLYEGIGSVSGLGGMLLVIAFGGSLPWLAAAASGIPLLATLANGVDLFWFRCPWLWPRWKCVTIAASKKVFGLGISFFVLQFAVAVTYSSDNLIAAQLLGIESVAEYAVAMRLFAFASIIPALILSPLWPAYCEAWGRGDLPWVKKTLMTSLMLAFLTSGVAALLLTAFGPIILQLWVSSGLTISLILLIGLGVWSVVGACGNALTIFLNGAHVIRFQVATTMMTAIGKVVLSVVLATYMGLPGIVWGTVLSYIIFYATPSAVMMRSLLQEMTSEAAAVSA
jgi:O-antigen/teichoic acid export membrane protein